MTLEVVCGQSVGGSGLHRHACRANAGWRLLGLISCGLGEESGGGSSNVRGVCGGNEGECTFENFVVVGIVCVAMSAGPEVIGYGLRA